MYIHFTERDEPQEPEYDVQPPVSVQYHITKYINNDSEETSNAYMYLEDGEWSCDLHQGSSCICIKLAKEYQAEHPIIDTRVRG